MDAARAMRRPRHATIAVKRDHHEHTDRAEFLANRGQDQVGVAGGQIARVAEAQSRARRGAAGHGPCGVGELVAAAHGVVPGRLPHGDACSQRARNPELIPQVEARREEPHSHGRHADPRSRDGEHRQEHEREQQRGPKVAQQKKQRQRDADARQQRQDVVGARQVRATPASAGCESRRSGVDG